MDSEAGRNSPPTTVRWMPGLVRANGRMSVELVTILTKRLPSRCRATSAVVVPASIMIVSPSLTSAAAAWAIRLLASTLRLCLSRTSG